MNTSTNKQEGYPVIEHDIQTAGRIGLDGKTPYIGDNGHWWVSDHDTGVIAGIQPAIFELDPATGQLAIRTEVLGARFSIENDHLIAEV